MDRRLDGFLGEKDYYSAHQLLLSHGQKLQRAGKTTEAGSFLFSGIVKLNKANASATIIKDIVSKYLGLEADKDYDQLMSILNITVDKFEGLEEGGFEGFWREVAIHVFEIAEPEKVIERLVCLQEKIQADDIMSFSLDNCPDAERAFAILGNKLAIDNGLFLSSCLGLLQKRCFSTTFAFKNSFTRQSALAKEQQIKGNADIITPEEGEEAKTFNLITLLCELLRRANPPRELFTQLQVRYSSLLHKDDAIKSKWKDLQETFWPVRGNNNPTAVNPLASMLQSLMMNRQ